MEVMYVLSCDLTGGIHGVLFDIEHERWINLGFYMWAFKFDTDRASVLLFLV